VIQADQSEDQILLALVIGSGEVHSPNCPNETKFGEFYRTVGKRKK
jgi:hypothetical protein